MRASRLLPLVDALMVALSVAVGATVAMGWAARLPHPYDLEWMEGGMLAHAWRLQQGASIYPVPGPEFVPFVYPPGYPAVLALLGTVFDLGHPLGRALAIFGTVAAAAALLTGVVRQGGQVALGVAAVALFLGTWPASGAFFDLVRPDALSLGLLAWALVLGLERGRGAVVASGLLLAAAWACKHNAAAFGGAMLLGITLRDGWRRGALFAAASALPALALTLGLQWSTDGRFLQYLLGVPASHPIVGSRIWPGTPGELVSVLPFVLPVAGLGLFVRARESLRLGVVPLVGVGLLGAIVAVVAMELPAWPRGVNHPGWPALWPGGGALGAGLALVLLGLSTRARSLPWQWVYGGGVAVTALITAGLMRGHHGGYVNVLMPLHWVSVFGVGIVAARLRTQPFVGLLAGLLVTAQLATQYVQLDVERLVPTAEDRAAGDRVVALVREHCEGPVLSAQAAWIPYQAGMAPSVHLIALWDIDHAGGPFEDEVDRIRRAAEEHWWDCVIYAGRGLRFGIPENYTPVERLPVSGSELWPATGWRVRPTELWKPR